ncbi:MAG: glycosyl hydrolase [Bacteroidota bacterium]
MNPFACLIPVLLFFSFSCDPRGTEPLVPEGPFTQGRSVKRGVSFNFQNAVDIKVLGKGVSWSYNWAPSFSPLHDTAVDSLKMDYCPMAWNSINEAALREYISSHPDCRYLLGFNEPNMTSQSDMTPSQAAMEWVKVKGLANELGLKMISPALNYGNLPGYSDPIVWLDEFFSLVPLEDVEGIAVHCYMPGVYSVVSFLEKFKKYGKPIWLTEFCAWDGLNENSFTAEGQQQFMSDMINYLESDPDIFRYAWFIPRGGGSEDNFPYMFLLKATSQGTLTDLGKIFVGMSSLDTSIYYAEQQIIEAEHYNSISISESLNGTWVSGPRVRVTSEAPNESLELYNFLPQQWVEYRLRAEKSKVYSLEFRYATFIDSEIEIEIDGIQETVLNLENTGQDYIWNTVGLELTLSEGRHIIRITPSKGRICLNWLRFS